MELSISKCNKCGNMTELLINGGAQLVCCGEAMENMKANSTDAAGEKHVPVVTVEGNKVVVEVGSVAHPMTEKHHIAYVILVSEKTTQRIDLDHTGEPKAEFTLAADDKAVAAYEFCNLHGLWKTEIN